LKEKLSQPERTARHKAKHPQGEAGRKEKQRQQEGILLFHIKRNHISNHEIPADIDQGSAAFKRIRDNYLETAVEAVEVS